MTDTLPSENTKEQVAVFLPAALATAIQSYKTYYGEMNPKETDKFAEYHKNAKVALAHIELLLKLAKWADVKDQSVERALSDYGSDALSESNDYHNENTLET